MQLLKNLKTYFLFIFKGLGVFVGLIFLYVLIAVLLSLIPYNKDFESRAGGIPVYIISNGIHIDLAFAKEHADLDWEGLLHFEKFEHQYEQIKYFRFGWGDKAFMIETPEWADLTVYNTVKALFVPSESTMHFIVTSHPPKMKERTRLVSLSQEEFKILEKLIFDQFKAENGKGIAINYEGYKYYDDHFYKAIDSYTMFNTCNNWINRLLKKSGIKTSYWTPFEQAIIYHLD